MANTTIQLLTDSTSINNSFIELLQRKRDEIIALLCEYETYETAQDEIARSINTLEGTENEFKTIEKPLEGLHIATIFPLNLPLYSLVLFGIMPSFFAKHVFIRPPEVMHETLMKIFDLLEINTRYSNVTLHPTPRQLFVDLYAKECDVIIFTGKYTNALDIHSECPNALLVYNGSGVNPFLLLDNGDVEECVKKAVEMRCFNSGQDCAGPDIFLVPEALADSFVNGLINELSSIHVGPTRDHSVRIGPIMKETYVSDIAKILEGEEVYWGGRIDFTARIVYPTIIRKNISDYRYETIHEYFAPVFNVITYGTITELTPLLTSRAFTTRGMYISLFGTNEAVETILSTSCRILRNKIVNDVERGNTAYGGYGDEANFLLLGDKKEVGPVLISRDIHKFTLESSED